MISGKLDGERPSVHGKELESAICLACLPGCSVQFLIDSSIISLRVQRRGRNKVVWTQLVPTGCRDPGGVCSRLSSDA